MNYVKIAYVKIANRSTWWGGQVNDISGEICVAERTVTLWEPSYFHTRSRNMAYCSTAAAGPVQSEEKDRGGRAKIPGFNFVNPNDSPFFVTGSILAENI